MKLEPVLTIKIDNFVRFGMPYQVTSGHIMTQKLEVPHAGVLGDNLSF